MRRILLITAVLASGGIVAVLGTGATNNSGGNYQVRAIFDSAFSVIPGEDVKIAGVKVGKIGKLDVTPDKRAAIVLDIQKPGFGDFRTDATCSIRPQSLIGEKFVECTPTQPRQTGAPIPPPLQKITNGPGKGQFLLPVTNTTHTIDLDLLNNILRMPYRQRLSIILNEFGTAVAGRGQDLNDVLLRANPALQQLDRVLRILAAQNHTLENLARDSDTVLAPLAARRAQVADFIVKANTTAQATAAERGNLERNIQKFPTFLRQLKPTLTRLGSLSDEMSPVLEDLGSQAPAISRFILKLGPFSRAGRLSFPSLGAAARVGTRAAIKIRPVTNEVRLTAKALRPVGTDLAAILSSLRSSGGIERFMDYLYFQVAAINGFDSLGHYLRAGLLLNFCTTYAITPTSGCEATFQKNAGAVARSAIAKTPYHDDPRRSLALRRQDAILHGMSPAEAMRTITAPGNTTATATARTAATRRTRNQLRLPASVLPSSSGSTTATSGGGRDRGGPSSQQAGLLDYLLGGGA
ncbi:MAG TPA: MlaD family protein [Solirubrobacteraceae bacterium]|jgi:ABC-type transporter Mla subunit MlaD